MSTPPQKLYSLNQITVAAFIGSPFPGFWLASRNLAALGRKKESQQSLIWGAGLTLAGFSVAFLLPEKFPALAISLPFVIATRAQAKKWSAHDLIMHLSAGGQFCSWWTSILGGLGAMILILAILFGMDLMLGDES